MMCQCGLLRWNKLVGEAGGGVYGKISVFSVQFCWEPTTVLKNKVRKEGRKEGRKGRKANKKKEKKKTKQASRGKELRVQERPAADHIISVPGSIRSRKNCGCFRWWANTLWFSLLKKNSSTNKEGEKKNCHGYTRAHPHSKAMWGRRTCATDSHSSKSDSVCVREREGEREMWQKH